MSSLLKITEDLIKFYVKQNYDKYLSDNKLSKIDECKIDGIINSIFEDKLIHMRSFLIESIPKLYNKDDTVPSKSIINNLLDEIFEDEKLCKLKLKKEILLYQKNI